VKGSHTVVDMPLNEILDGGHAINVHLSAEEIDTSIACGDISGVVLMDEDDGERQLIIGLGDLNDSGHSGIAWISEEGDQTEVAVNLIEPDEMQSGRATSRGAGGRGIILSAIGYRLSPIGYWLFRACCKTP
jgi:hypothetical protein